MIQIIKCDNLFEKRILKSNLSFYDQKIFIEAEKEGNYGRPYRYIGVQKFSQRLNQLKKFKFNNPTEIFTRVTSGRTIYFGYIEIIENKYFINIHKLDCETGAEERSICIDTGFNNDKPNSFDVEIIGLSECYALLMIRYIDSDKFEYGQPFFKRMILIDTNTKNTMVVPDKVCDFDTLLRVGEILLFDNGKYLMIKTGRIQPNEKKVIWEDSLKKSSFEEYFDHLETLIVIKTEDFIKSVENGIGITNKNILDICDLHRCFKIITDWDNIGSKEFVYAIQSFREKTTQIKIFNFETGQISNVKSDKLYDLILYLDKKIYGMQEQNNSKIVDELHINILEQENIVKDIYDIAKNNKIF
ncbi:MAG: hypothetical protein P4L49_10365, partial [Desulfosporosinus sp.]|nr:hypothetical protein [Desulfosporosinus sp.]